jgi:hypothetical protein
VNERLRFRSFESARELIRSQELKDRQEWNRYCKSGKLPDDVPHNPEKTYKKEWKGWGYWLGIHVISVHTSFEDARDIVHQLGLKNRQQWYQYCKSGKKPINIPTHPDRTYKDNKHAYIHLLIPRSFTSIF